MPVHPLPPQAYTKETLQKAYTWLLTQSPSVKEMASTQDILISLYLKAQRNGAESLDTPSIQNFKQELKSLANMMGDFQTTGQPATHPSFQATPPTAPSHPAAPAMTYTPPLPNSEQFASSPQMTATRVANSGLLQTLDPVTSQYLADFKTILNLSSDSEALRAAVSLGHRQLKKI